MKLRQSLALLLLLFAGIVSAHAQIGTAIVNATGTFSVTPSDTITLKAQIVSCGAGQLPLYNGTPISLTPNQTPAAPFTASNSGSAQSVSFTVPGNDGISCGGQNYSLYAITWYDNGFPLAPTQTFRFAEQTTQTLAQLAPVSFIPPVIVNSAGALCPSTTPVFSGFDKNYHILCGTTGSISAMPLSGGTFTGAVVFSQSATFNSSTTFNAPVVQTLINPFKVNYAAIQVINGIPQADQFTGADFCVKLRAAEVYALANSIRTVDATHFTKTQGCSVDPFVNLATGGVTGTVNLEINLPAAVISFTVPIQVNDTGIKIRGKGRGNTVWLYTGSATSTNLFTIGGDAVNFTQFVEIHDFSVVDSHTSGSSNNDVQVYNSHRDILENISAWGGNTCFIEAGAVTDTLSNLHCSNQDAANFGWAGYQSPVTGLYLTIQGADDTTDGTVRDISVEFVTGIGIHLVAADNMVFTAGTSEGNLKGIVVDTNPGHNKWNSFIGMDIEGNSANVTGVDVTDNGQSNFYINGLYSSPCTGGCTASLLAGGGGGQFLMGDAGPLHGWTGPWNVLGNNSDFSQNGGTFKIGIAAVTTANITQMNSGDIEGSGTFKGPIYTSNGALPTCAQGTGVTTCSVSAGSTQARGFITITNATATTTAVLGTLNFASSLAGVPFCSLQQSGGVAYYGLFSNSTTAAHFTIVNTQTVSGVTTIQLSYFCNL